MTSTYTSSGTRVGRLDMAEGWPYVGYTALAHQQVTVPDGLETRDGGRWLATTVGDTTYGLAVARADGSRRDLDPSGGEVRLGSGETLLAFAGRNDKTLTALAAGAVPVHGTSISYDVARGRARTRIVYRTPHGHSTVLAAMPHQRLDHPDVLGARRLAVRPPPAGPLACPRHRRPRPATGGDPGPLRPGSAGAHRGPEAGRRRRGQGGQRASSRRDTYFGGKDVYRMAQLARVARAAGAGDAARKIRERAVSELDAWLTRSSTCTASSTRCFSYDTAFKGVLGRKASFGSDEFNDHHFHYGYFLGAAALLAKGHPDLLDRWRPTLTALAEDIASPAANSKLPALRTFDPYAGHSWAAGKSVFADGNNQESSSEAISAWNGLALWARADGNRTLARQATWQLSLETAAARAYWLQPRHLPAGYGHSFVSLNWGGKREWATWFSADPAAILGIQLLPMPPVLAQGHVDKKRVRANVADASAGGFDTSFGDYLTMYLALAEPGRALHIGRHLPDSALDDGDSRSYLLAWLLSARAGDLRGATERP